MNNSTTATSNTTTVESEYQKWQFMTQTLMPALWSEVSKVKSSSHDRYEVEGALERWALTVCNAYAGDESAIFLTFELHEDDIATVKLASELLEKHLITDYQQATVCALVTRLVNEFVQRLMDDPQGDNATLAAVPATILSPKHEPPGQEDSYLSLLHVDYQNKPAPADADNEAAVAGDVDTAAVVNVTDNGETYQYKQFIATRVPADLLAQASPDEVMIMLLRYASLFARSQQWSIPRRVYDYLYSRGYRKEAFASPLNSKLRGRANTEYFSLFPDVDTQFGSAGDFFSANLQEHRAGGHWIVNPPFVEQIMYATVEKIVAHLDWEVDHHCNPDVKAPGSTTFLLLVPRWTDGAAFRAAKTSVYTRAMIRLDPGTYQFEQLDNKCFSAPFACTLFLMSLDPSCEERIVVTGFVDPLLAAFAPPANGTQALRAVGKPARARQAI